MIFNSDGKYFEPRRFVVVLSLFLFSTILTCTLVGCGDNSSSNVVVQTPSPVALKASTSPTTAAEVSTLSAVQKIDIALTGIVGHADGSKTALISIDGKASQLVALGQRLSNGLELINIGDDYVIVKDGSVSTRIRFSRTVNVNPEIAATNKAAPVINNTQPLPIGMIPMPENDNRPTGNAAFLELAKKRLSDAASQ